MHFFSAFIFHTIDVECLTFSQAVLSKIVPDIKHYVNVLMHSPSFIQSKFYIMISREIM